MKLGYNMGSGQRPFRTVPTQIKWVNIDSQDRWNPDWWGDAAHTPFATGEADYVVLHHVLEHYGCNEGLGLIQEAHRLLKPGGSLLVFVPNLRALAQRWLDGGISTQIYVTNIYGAYMGDESDRHKWGFDQGSLHDLLRTLPWKTQGWFAGRTIPGADIARDWWIVAAEAVA